MIPKKVLPFLLLAIFSFNIVGYFIAFKVVQHQIKREIKSTIKLGLKASELTAIQINKKDLNELVWEEKNKEFHYKGELYDIVKTEENSQYIIYYCINDKQEEQLFENLEEHMNNYISDNHLSKKNSSKKAQPDSIKLYLSNRLSATIAITNNTAFFNTYPLLYTSACVDISSPPPEIG